MTAQDEARAMHWASINDRHLRSMYAAMDDIATELERARRLSSPDASEMESSIVTSSAARITALAAKFAEHAYSLDALREASALITLTALPTTVEAAAWHAEWAMEGRDRAGNAILLHKPTGGSYRLVPVED